MRKLARFGYIAIVVFAAGMTLAAGSDTKGKFYFKKTCKTCHAKGAEAGEVTPLVKTQEQWKRYFDKGTHSKGTQKLVGRGSGRAAHRHPDLPRQPRGGLPAARDLRLTTRTGRSPSSGTPAVNPARRGRPVTATWPDGRAPRCGPTGPPKGSETCEHDVWCCSRQP